MIKKLLIANRGEIACRIIKTAKQLGITTVAVYSKADQNAPHVKQADEAYCIGEAISKDSYLNPQKIIAIAKQHHCDSIHPGYGFLSENAGFAKLCEDNQIIFVGPTATAIEAMGSKSIAKKILTSINIPMIPGYHGDDQTLAVFYEQAEKIGYPVLLKAAAGGGGKGMRVVENKSELENAYHATKREALAGFNDDHLLIEKYLQEPRHIEIQIFADNFGNVVYLFERDCSIQRRHQKIIEEAPAVNFPENLRKQIGETAVQIAKHIHYTGAGTVEFLLDKNQHFYFMEMNTRLQVEHPITEMITGLDLVAWQLQIASDEKLPLSQELLSFHGHAIEVRICAEDPNHDFLPAIGEIKYLNFPKTSALVRIDTGVTTGSVISPYYDSMIAKLIVYGKDREHAILELEKALIQTQIVGLKNNINYLLNLIREQDYKSGKLNTSFIPEHPVNTSEDQTDTENYIYASAILSHQLKNQYSENPWESHQHWRLNQTSALRWYFQNQDENILAYVYLDNENLKIQCLDKTIFLHLEKTAEYQYQISTDEKIITIFAYRLNHLLYLSTPKGHFVLSIFDPQKSDEQSQENAGSLAAPMPGTVIALQVAVGQQVNKGDRLMVMEAMKMEHTIHAPHDGTVKAVHYQVGEMVSEGSALLTIE